MKRIKLFEDYISEKREDVGKYNTVKKVVAKLGRRPSEQELAQFITDNYYDVTEVERGEDDPSANDKIADLVAFYKFDIDDWQIAWADAQNESVVTEGVKLNGQSDAGKAKLAEKEFGHLLPADFKFGDVTTSGGRKRLAIKYKGKPAFEFSTGLDKGIAKTKQLDKAWVESGINYIKKYVAESQITEVVDLVHVYDEDGKMFGTGELVKTKGKKSLIRWDGSREEWVDSKLVKVVESKQSDALAKAIDKAIIKIDDSMSYEDFALAVGKILKEEYGSHLFGKFMEVLHKDLGI